MIAGKRKKSTTIWNILALLTILVGGATTLLLSEGQVRHWARNTGTAIPVGQWGNIDLPYGEFLVFYESPAQVPSSYLFEIIDPYGDRMRSGRAPEEENYQLRLSGWSGKAIGTLTIEEAGTYRLRCSNASVATDAEVPAEDRITLMKTPATWTEASQSRKQILVVGGSITFALFVVLYIMHGLTLRSRAKKQTPLSNTQDIDQTMDVAV